MCGIAGQFLLEHGPAPEAGLLRALARRMQHRGPDDEGVYLRGRAGFAFRRLAIIDLVTGAQPMSSADGLVTVVFNGEIYNHRTLQRELEARGCVFRTRSDTEVLVHGWREWGKGLPARLEGMFAFAVHDTHADTLFLARDRMGKKPLVWTRQAGALWFASEIATLRALPGFEAALDPEAIDLYLAHQCIPHPRSIYRAVHKLPPAGWLEVRGGEITEGRFWTPAFEPKRRESEGELALELRGLLRAAVERRLESEVPLGAFLSGGLDSSTVVGLMHELVGPGVRTFTIGFGEEEYDERPFARLVAQRFRTEHHELVVRPDVARDLPRILGQYGEPFADKSAVPSWYVAREAARELRVVLTGDGGDDLFAGYGKYVTGFPARVWDALPGGPRRAAERALLACMDSPALWPLGHLARRSCFAHARALVTSGFFYAHERARLYRPEFAAALAGGGAGAFARALHARTADLPTAQDRMLASDQEQYLAGDLLPKVDISCMAHSLEARSPFLDREVVAFAQRLPDSARIRDGDGKHIVKQAVAGLVPEEILRREKRGFSVPVDRWLAGPLAPLLRELVVEDARGLREFCRPEELRRLYDEHVGGRRRHGGRLWALLAYELWFRSSAS